jgi:hypothetical protein
VKQSQVPVSRCKRGSASSRRRGRRLAWLRLRCLKPLETLYNSIPILAVHAVQFKDVKVELRDVKVEPRDVKVEPRGPAGGPEPSVMSERLQPLGKRRWRAPAGAGLVDRPVGVGLGATNVQNTAVWVPNAIGACCGVSCSECPEYSLGRAITA